MKVAAKNPPRTFSVGARGHIVISDCGRIDLEPDEQVTFTAAGGAEYDVARKSWGFYATPSLNGRLKNFGWRTALVKSPDDRYFIFLLEPGKQAEFDDYIASERQQIVCWLEDDAVLSKISGLFADR